MNRFSLIALKTLIALLLLVTLAFEVLVAVGLSMDLAMDPGFTGGADLLVVVSVLGFVICGQVMLASIWRLATLAAADRIFNPAAFRWVRVMLISTLAAAGCTLGATIGVTPAIVKSDIPPVLVVVGLFVIGLCLVLALVITVMRSLLEQAVAFKQELEEVV